MMDDLSKVSGGVRYACDAALPGMLHSKLLRSPYPHARILGIDATAALALPGVVCVVTGEDAARLPDPRHGFSVRDQPVIAIGKVRYVGDPVAAVVAVDERTAVEALALVKVDYNPLPPVPTMEAALATGAPLLFDEPHPGVPLAVGAGSWSRNEPAPNVLYEYGYARGDVDADLAAAAHVFTDSFAVSRISHFYLEPYSGVARVEAGQVELWSCNQDPFMIRGDISRMFGLPVNDIRIHSPTIGGGFGGKSYCKLEPLIVLMAMKAKAPVRLALTLDESLLTLTKHAGVLTLTTGIDRDGRLIARRSELRLDGGAYADASAMVALKVAYRITGPYRWRSVFSRASIVRTTTVPAGSYRGFGGTQASYASECQIDMIARRIGLDPYEMRRRNLLDVGEPFAPGDSGMDSDLRRGLDEVCRRIGYRDRVRRAGRGIGLAVGIKDGGGTGNHAQAVVTVSQSGDVTVGAGTTEIGQGAASTLCSIATRALGLPLANARYAPIDTDRTPLNNGTHVSCGTTVTGTAVQRAAEDARAQILEFAAGQLQCRPEELDFDGWAVRHGGETFPLGPLISSWFGGVGYVFIGHGGMKVPYDERSPVRARNLFWMPSWAGAEVEVDSATGQLKILQLVVGADAGHAIDPASCVGQIAGAALQAFGLAMFEELRYRDGAMPENADPRSYRVPMALDLPDRFDCFVEEHGMGPGPFRAKGLGESGMLAVAAAIANAIEDATGVRVTQTPFTPERILDAIDAQSPANQWKAAE
jgi:CO/xanthine dehydrogenase Mo-binding subunit